MLMSKNVNNDVSKDSPTDCTLVLLNVHACVKRAIERLLHLNEV